MYTKSQFERAIPGTWGIWSNIARRVGCHIVTAQQYVRGDPDLLALYEVERGRILDKAELTIYSDLDEVATAKWVVTNKVEGAERGFVPPSQRVELTGRGGQGLELGIDFKASLDRVYDTRATTLDGEYTIVEQIPPQLPSAVAELLSSASEETLAKVVALLASDTTSAGDESAPDDE